MSDIVLSREPAMLRSLPTEETVPYRPPAARWYRRHERRILGITGLLIFFVLWQLGSSAGVLDPFIFSSPIGMLLAGAEQVQLPRFWQDVATSTLEFTVGAAIALATAIPLGLLIGWYRRLGYAAEPWLNLFNSLPRIAFLPVLVLWLGLGIQPKIAAVFLGAFFAVIVPTARGVRTVERRLLDVGTSFGASQRLIFSSIVLPATVPFIVSGLQIATSRALLGVIIAEIFNLTTGLGVMIHKASDNLNKDRMYFGILLFTMAGVLLSKGVDLLERRSQRWRPAVDSEEAG